MKISVEKNQTLLCLGLFAVFAHNADAQTCASAGITVPPEFIEVTQAPSVATWPTKYAPVQAPWNGGIQTGCTVMPNASMQVALYRAWGGGSAAGTGNYSQRMGGWWSLQNPITQYPTVTDWRAANAVCPTFNTATTVTMCTLKPDTKVVIGYTQSIYYQATPGYAECVYPQNNKALQVSVSNYPVNTAFADACADTSKDIPVPVQWLGR
ncbi:MAG: hypothetical protein WA056_04210 [Gallionella sp.]